MSGNSDSLNSGSADTPQSGMQPDLTEQEASSTSSGPLSEAEKADEIAALLQGEFASEEEEGPPEEEPGGPVEGYDDPAGEAGPGDPAPEGAGEVAERLTPKDIAAKLGVSPEDVYNMEITTGDGEKTTFQAIKDAWEGRGEAERVSAERDAELNSREAKVIADQQVWSVLAAQGRLPQEAIEVAQEQIADHNQSQHNILMELVPEWRDDAKLDNFRAEMVRVLGEVGLKPHEIALSDHRQALFIRKYLQQEKELKALRKQVAPKAPKAGKPQGRGKPGPSQSAFIRQASQGSEADKVAAVGRLLNGG